MAGYVEICVGYRARDPLRDYADFLGGRCVDCGELTFYNMSAHDLFTDKLNDHDVTVVCSVCHATNRKYIEDAMV